MKNIAVLYNEYTPTVDAIINQLNGDFEVSSYNKSEEIKNADLIVGVNSKENYNGFACHHSLLPAFSGDEPVKQALEAGVKVTGITVYYTNPYRIIAQYPLMIANNWHYDDVRKQLMYLEQVIYPLVVEKYVKNEVFDIRELISKPSCSGNCSTCGGCK